MKRLIFLHIPDPDPENKLSNDALRKAQQKSLTSSIQSFKDAIKQVEEKFDIKILQDLSPLPQLVIEFPDKPAEDILNLLRSMEVVELIDPHLPLSDKDLKAKIKNDLKCEAILQARPKPTIKSKKKKKQEDE